MVVVAVLISQNIIVAKASWSSDSFSDRSSHSPPSPFLPRTSCSCLKTHGSRDKRSHGSILLLMMALLLWAVSKSPSSRNSFSWSIEAVQTAWNQTPTVVLSLAFLNPSAHTARIDQSRITHKSLTTLKSIPQNRLAVLSKVMEEYGIVSFLTTISPLYHFQISIWHFGWRRNPSLIWNGIGLPSWSWSLKKKQQHLTNCRGLGTVSYRISTAHASWSCRRGNRMMTTEMVMTRVLVTCLTLWWARQTWYSCRRYEVNEW